VIFARFWPDTKPVRGRWWTSLVLVGAAPALSTAAIWMFKILIDRMVVPHDFRLFPVLAGAYVGLALVQGAVSFADRYLSTWVGERFVLSVRATSPAVSRTRRGRNVVGQARSPQWRRRASATLLSSAPTTAPLLRTPGSGLRTRRASPRR
jgi:hypothetical protein